MYLLYIIVSLLMLQGKAIQMLPNEHALGPKIMSNLVHKPLARLSKWFIYSGQAYSDV